MSELSSSDPRAPVLDRYTLAAIVEIFGSEDSTAILDLLDTFLIESSKQCDEMTAAMVARDWTKVHRVAHSLKSSSATFGAMRLAQAAARLEAAAKTICVEGKCAELLDTVLGEHAVACTALRAERAAYAAG